MPTAALALTAAFCLAEAPVQASGDEADPRTQRIPILATALDNKQNPIGVVAEVEVSLLERKDQKGIDVHFDQEPGRFSRAAQVAVVSAILDIARVAHMSTDSWTISLTMPYQGVTVYGQSLSAMIGITVIALAKGDLVKPEHVVTGTIMSDGHIGPVSGIGLKLQAASARELDRVLVPEEYDESEGDWSTPFLLHVTPVGTVNRAYKVLTDHDFPALQFSQAS